MVICRVKSVRGASTCSCRRYLLFYLRQHIFLFSFYYSQLIFTSIQISQKTHNTRYSHIPTKSSKLSIYTIHIMYKSSTISCCNITCYANSRRILSSSRGHEAGKLAKRVTTYSLSRFHRFLAEGSHDLSLLSSHRTLHTHSTGHKYSLSRFILSLTTRSLNTHRCMYSYNSNISIKKTK